MAPLPNSYGSTAGVAALVKHATDKVTGLFTTTTKPTLAEVEGFLDQQSAKLNAWLAGCQYVIPVAQADAKLVLDEYANLGAAGLAELTLRSAGFKKAGENDRADGFLTMFKEARDFICSGALAAMGAPQTTTEGSFIGLFTGGQTASGQPLKPIFRRTSFDNDPTTESGSDEPGY